jgi:hypothetical protein
MADASLQIGNGNWAVKTSLLLGYNVVSNRYNPIEIGVTRETTGSRTNVAGIIDYKDNNIARINYEGGVGSLLLESQRTNLALQSQTFDNPSWAKTSTIITPNTTISSDGTLNADSMEVSSIDSRVSQALVLGAGTYTATVYVKILSQTTAGTMRLQANVDSANVSVNFTPTTEWKRVTASYNASIGITTFSIRGLSFIGTIAIWGAQFEQGAYPTSYIPTTTTALTRNADLITRNNIYTNNYITSVGGTWFVELNNNVPYIRDTFASGIYLDTTNGGFVNGFSIRNVGTTSQTLSIVKYVSGTGTFLVNPTSNIVKIAIKWNGTTADVFVNGVKVVSATAFTTTAMEFLNANGIDVPKYIKSMLLFPTPLTDTEMINLTTL